MSEGHAVADTQETDSSTKYIGLNRHFFNAVMAEQTKCIELGTSLDAMQAALAEKRANMERMKAGVHDWKARERAHDDMLARHAIGQVSVSEFEAHQAEMIELQAAAHQADIDMAQAKRTADALERKCADLKAEITKSLEEKKRMVCQLLTIEAQAEAVNYVKAARDIELSYLRLRALNMMIENRGGKGFFKRSEPLRVPDFDLEACNRHKKPVALNALLGFDERFDRNKVLAAAVFEIKVLRDESGVLLQDDDSDALELVIAAREGLAT